MNQASSEHITRNPWASRDQLAPIPKLQLILAAAICFLCSVCIPFCNNGFVALSVLAILFAYVALVGRNPITVSLILISTVLCVVLASVAGLGLAVGSVLLSCVVGCMTGAFLMTVCRRAFWVPLLPIAGAVIAFALDRQPLVALSALAFLPAAILLAVATLRGSRRTAAICCAEGGLLLSVLAVAAVLVWRTQGRLDITAIRASIEALREGFAGAIETIREQNLAIMAEAGAANMPAEWTDRVNTLYSRDTALQMFSVLPAVIAFVCGIMAFESQSLLNAAYRTAGLKSVLTPNACIFTMSLTAAILYTLSFVLMIFLSPSSVVGAVAQNLSIILMPGLCVIGVQSLLVSIARARGGMRIFLIVIAVMLFCCSGAAFYMIAMWGAYGIVMLTMQKSMVERIVRNGQNRDDSSDDSDRQD